MIEDNEENSGTCLPLRLITELRNTNEFLMNLPSGRTLLRRVRT